MYFLLAPAYNVVHVYMHVFLLAIFICGSRAGVCKVGYGYPVSCPRPGDNADLTRCCRYFMIPMCCEDRANHVCAVSKHSRSSLDNYDPPLSMSALFCPQPGQSDSYRACKFGGSAGMQCIDVNPMIIGFCVGFGVLALAGVILCAVCCYKVRKGDWVCITIRRNGRLKKTLVTRKKYEEMKRLHEMDVQRRQADQQGAPQNGMEPQGVEPHYMEQQPSYPAGILPPMHTHATPGYTNQAYWGTDPESRKY